MNTTTRTRATAGIPTTRHNAVVWIEPGRALVVRERTDGGTDTFEIGIPSSPAVMPPALAIVAHQVGEADHVLVLGPEELRTALEREIVAIGHRPDAIREGLSEGPVDRDVMLGKLRRLA